MPSTATASTSGTKRDVPVVATPKVVYSAPTKNAASTYTVRPSA